VSESGNSSGSGYETDSNRSYWEQGHDAVTNANVNEIPSERLKDYASTNKDMLHGEKDGQGYSTAAEAQAFFDATVSRHNALRAELNRRKELKECPSNESISSLGSLRDHKYSSYGGKF
jgi:hypothetical protein